MFRHGITKDVIIWKDGTTDSQRSCGDCKSSGCVKPTHKEKYRETKKREKLEDLRSLGIRINAVGAYVLDEEYEVRYPSETYSVEAENESTERSGSNQAS